MVAKMLLCPGPNALLAISLPKFKRSLKIMNSILDENIVNVSSNCQRIRLNSECLRGQKKEKFCVYSVIPTSYPDGLTEIKPCSCLVSARSAYNIRTCEGL